MHKININHTITLKGILIMSLKKLESFNINLAEVKREICVKCGCRL